MKVNGQESQKDQNLAGFLDFIDKKGIQYFFYLGRGRGFSSILFSLQSSRALSDPCWGTIGIHLKSYVFLVVWGGVLARVFRRDPSHGVKSRKSVMGCSKGVGKRSIKAETIEMPSKPRKDLVESFTRQGGYLGSG